MTNIRVKLANIILAEYHQRNNTTTTWPGKQNSSLNIKYYSRYTFKIKLAIFEIFWRIKILIIKTCILK